MALLIEKVANVTALYKRLAALCDTGFALAVHIRYTRPALLYQTYSAAWIDQYNEQGFMLSDPTVRWGLTNTGSMIWDDLAADDSAGVLLAAREFGLVNGWTYATGPATSRSMASMTRSTPFSAAQCDDIRAIIDEIHRETDGVDQLPVPTQEALRAIG